jgi:hypothetical protein
MVNDQTPKVEWLHCNQCLRNTKHHVLAEHPRRVVEQHGEHEYWWAITNTLFECCGCEFVTLRRNFMSSESDEEEITFYPPPVSRSLPSWHHHLPWKMQELLREIYTALHSDSRWLALMGTRALIDLFMVDKIGDRGAFTEKLKKLVEKGYLANHEKEILNTALEAGNAATHRGYKPESEELNHVVDVVERLIHTYILKEANDVAKAKIPPRKKKPG